MGEERILVLTTHHKDGECECVMQDGCRINDSCAICNVGISRLDAIERIAEALCRKDSGIKSCHECIHNGTANCGYTLNEWFSEDAEAALNALLEVEK